MPPPLATQDWQQVFPSQSKRFKQRSIAHFCWSRQSNLCSLEKDYWCWLMFRRCQRWSSSLSKEECLWDPPIYKSCFYVIAGRCLREEMYFCLCNFDVVCLSRWECQSEGVLMVGRSQWRLNRLSFAGARFKCSRIDRGLWDHSLKSTTFRGVLLL